MAASTPPLRPENAGLAFIGEQPWSPARLTAKQALHLAAASNPTGRLNSDVIQRGLSLKSGHSSEHWQIDFPLHGNEAEANLYAAPSRHLKSNQPATTAEWWRNPHAKIELRTSLARLERSLVTPLAATALTWTWIDSEVLPDANFIVVARDDDFIHGLLSSPLFLMWWQHFASLAPVDRVASFPFPWPPRTLLSALTRPQEEQRLALARAARSADPEQLATAATTAYGWPPDLSSADLLEHLIHQAHSRPGARL
jgi:hypothetical protein